ncbi:MAG: TraR/DksA family transcriptional regulator [Rhabdochlamydiaceae bacterium]|nr:TraR/DksA family transcriptional regulator [Candidatus Amphrikana amoebophyrae]
MALSKADIEEFKEKLLTLRAQHMGSLKEVSEDVKTTQGNPHSQHQADQGTDDFEKTISIGVGAREIYVLHQIERALEKIEEGTYGKCDMSGEDIPRKRLDATPYAIMTVESQAKMEKEEFEEME